MSGYIMDMRKLVGHRPILQVGASVIVDDGEGNLLLQLRKDNGCWGYHGGSVELDEDVREAAKREMFEETGLKARELQLFGVFSGPQMHYVYPNGDEVSNVDLVFVCSDYSGTPICQEEEVEALTYFPVNQLPENLFEANIPALKAYRKAFNAKRRPAAVVFDMDGVIFDSERLVVECWKDTAEKYGMQDVEIPCRLCLGVTREESERIFKEFYGQELPYWERKAEMSALFHTRYGEGRLPLKSGVRELLGWLKQEGIKTALASSTRREVVEQELADAGILSYFDAVICGDMVTRSKPDPEIFLKACAALDVAPWEAMGIEDSYHGVRSASTGELRTIMVPDLLPATEEIAKRCEAVLGSLDEVLLYLQSKFCENARL